ncbi:hypothetical protein [Aliivibrio salmonicida]|uniref:hypothetical protein n=1 Tax=Aliivibrio salmonicida TaxID=40269 RepID=UPI00309ECAD6
MHPAQCVATQTKANSNNSGGFSVAVGLIRTINMKFLNIFYLSSTSIQVRLNKKNKSFNQCNQPDRSALMKAALQFRNECYEGGSLPSNLLVKVANDVFKFSESKYHIRISAKSISDNRTYHLLSKKSGRDFDEVYTELTDVYAKWKTEYNVVVSLYNQIKLERFLSDAKAECEDLIPKITSTSFDLTLWLECVKNTMPHTQRDLDVAIQDPIDIEDVSYAFECELENTLRETTELPESVFISQDRSRLSLKPNVIINRALIETNLIEFINDDCSSTKYVPFSINFDYGSTDFLCLSIPDFFCGLPVNPSNHKIKINSYNSLNQAIYFLAVCQSRYFGYKLFMSNKKPSYADYQYRVSQILMNSTSFGSAEGQLLSYIHKNAFPKGTKQPISVLFERNRCERTHNGLILNLNSETVYFNNLNVSDIREKINLSVLALLAFNENPNLMLNAGIDKDHKCLDDYKIRYEYLDDKLTNADKNYLSISPTTTMIPLNPANIVLNNCTECGTRPITVFTPANSSNEMHKTDAHELVIYCPNKCREEIRVRSKHIGHLHDASLRWCRLNINSLITTKSYMFGLRSTYFKFGINAHRVKILLIEEYLCDVYEHQRLSIMLKDSLGLKLNSLTNQINENAYKWATLLSDRIEIVFGHKKVSLEERKLAINRTYPTRFSKAKSVYYCEPSCNKVICRSSASKVRFY